MITFWKCTDPNRMSGSSEPPLILVGSDHFHNTIHNVMNSTLYDMQGPKSYFEPGLKASLGYFAPVEPA